MLCGISYLVLLSWMSEGNYDVRHDKGINLIIPAVIREFVRVPWS
jgi:hypothetical protein